MYVYVLCVGVHACVCMYKCMHTCGGQQSTLGAVPRSCLPWSPPFHLQDIFIIVCMRVLCTHMCESVGARGRQKRASVPLDLEFISGCDLPVWILGIELWSFARAICTLTD